MLAPRDWIVPEEERGVRLDRFLRARLPGIPSRSVRFAVESGEVRVNGEVAAKGRSLRAGDRVSVRRIAEERDWMPAPGDLPGARVLFADGFVAVLEKPHDCHTEPQRPAEAGTLAGYLLHRFPEVARISPTPGLTLLTRLDYATSGVVPAALDGDSFRILRGEREQGRIRKVYFCLVAGRVLEERILAGRIDGSGGETVRVSEVPSEPDPLRWTKITPIRLGARTTLVRAEIRRGKRHQIRAHLAAAGFPILGDRRYSAVPPEGPGRERLMLHAGEVVFSHPRTGKEVRVVSPLPGSFRVD
ncbi:MAG: RluA family pseudouridine synthase [Deltaproteobacteria bacterium]